MRVSRRKSGERGATILEGAITFLLFFTLLMAILEFGRAYYMYQTLTNAAREGARFSVAPYTQTTTLPSNSDVSDKVKYFLGAANVKNATVSVNQSYAQTLSGYNHAITYTRVDVSAPFRFVFFKFSPVTLSTHAVMRNENN